MVFIAINHKALVLNHILAKYKEIASDRLSVKPPSHLSDLFYC